MFTALDIWDEIMGVRPQLYNHQEGLSRSSQRIVIVQRKSSDYLECIVKVLGSVSFSWSIWRVVDIPCAFLYPQNS